MSRPMKCAGCGKQIGTDDEPACHRDDDGDDNDYCSKCAFGKDAWDDGDDADREPEVER